MIDGLVMKGCRPGFKAMRVFYRAPEKQAEETRKRRLKDRKKRAEFDASMSDVKLVTGRIRAAKPPKTGAFVQELNHDARRGAGRKRANAPAEAFETIPGRCIARLEQIKEIHARRQFNVNKWINWQMDQITSAGDKDLI